MAEAPTRADRWLLLTRRKALAFVAAWVAAVVLHNVVYALFQDAFGPGGDEPFLFLFAFVVLPAWVLVSAVYTVARRLRGGGGAPVRRGGRER